MATEKIKRITIWVIFAFVLYAIFTNPNKSADIVHNIWDLLATGVDVEAREAATEDQADEERDGHEDEAEEPDPERPPRHVSLGYQIILGPIMLVGGFYYAAYAFRHGGRVKDQAAVFYLLLGLCGILAGAALLLIATKGG